MWEIIAASTKNYTSKGGLGGYKTSGIRTGATYTSEREPLSTSDISFCSNFNLSANSWMYYSDYLGSVFYSKIIFLGSGSPAFLLYCYFLAGLGLGFLFLGDSGFGLPMTILFSGSHLGICFSY